MANYVFTGLFLLVGIWLVSSYFKSRRKIERSRQWTSVIGRLGEIQIEEHMQGSTDRSFRLNFAYEYEVGGKIYEGDQRRIRFSCGNMFQSRKAAQQRADEVTDKSPFLVYYDPSEPTESVLFLEDSSAALKILLVGAISILFGLIIFFASYL